jgi:hypothetical protein
MEKNLLELLEELKKKLESLGVANAKTNRFLKELNELIGLLKNIKVKEELANNYNELINKAIELNQGENYRNIKNMDKLISSCFRLYYENNGELGMITKKMVYTYIGTSILFFIVSFPTYISIPLLPVLFVAPMYVGIKAIQKRNLKNMLVGMIIIEFSVLTGIIGLFNAIYATKFNIFIVVYALISFGLIASGVYSSYYYNKYKKLFS